jgi:hypothetical protein
MALHSLTDFPLHLPANLATFAVFLGAVVGMESAREGSIEKRGWGDGRR